MTDEGPVQAPREAVHAAEEDDLGASLEELSRLSIRQLDLEGVLTSVATYAVRAIPGADGAGLTLLERGRADTVVSTVAFVKEIDDIQYGIGQGPCITAAAEARTVVSGSLGADPRWKRFGSQVARLGVHSVISLPLITSEGVLGAMNVYAHARDAFDQRAADLGELFAAPAAIAVQNAQALAEAQRLVSELRAAVSTRGAIDRAVGVMISRGGCTEQEALQRLRTTSMNERRPLAVVAQQLVDATVGRNRGHRG